MAGAIGFWNLIPKTAKYLKILVVPTIIGSVVGSELFIHTSTKMFDRVIPWLILMAATLLLYQPAVKKLAQRGGRTMSPWTGAFLQFLVAVYGGYFGAGMGIMMLAAFALFMEGNIHELNAVKSWLGLVINFAASVMFIFEGIVNLYAALPLTIGSIVGGFYAAKLSQKVNPDRMRVVIACYGIFAGLYFMYKAFHPASWPSLG